MNRMSVWERIISFWRGVQAHNKLIGMSDEDLMAQINYDAEDGCINTPYAAEYRRRNQNTDLRATIGALA